MYHQKHRFTLASFIIHNLASKNKGLCKAFTRVGGKIALLFVDFLVLVESRSILLLKLTVSKDRDLTHLRGKRLQAKSARRLWLRSPSVEPGCSLFCLSVSVVSTTMRFSLSSLVASFALCGLPVARGASTSKFQVQVRRA